MNSDTLKGALQKVGGHIEEAAGALVGSESLKVAGKEDELNGSAREAWGNVKDAGDSLVERARAAKYEAEAKSETAQSYEKEHTVLVETTPEKK